MGSAGATYWLSSADQRSSSPKMAFQRALISAAPARALCALV
jgi:hypothetical protein